MDINNILNSEENMFKKILEQIIIENQHNAKEELESTEEMNLILYDAIDFTLLKLEEEENFFSKILYNSFGIGKEKNQRRGQLIFLGSQLKSKLKNLERDKHKINYHNKNILSSIDNLTRLSTAFSRKIQFLMDEKLVKKCDKYLKEIYIKTDEANKCRIELDMKSIYLESCLSKYGKLLRKIPRYSELTEDIYLEYKSSS